MSVDSNVGKEYIREVYSDSQTRPRLVNAIKKFHLNWSRFDDFRNLARTSSTVTYSIFSHNAIIDRSAEVDYDDKKWDLYERDYLVVTLRELSNSVFLSDKADAVFQYVIDHGCKKAGQASLSPVNFIYKCDAGLAVQRNICHFFNKIVSQKFKTIDEKEKENSVSYKIDVLKNEISLLKAKCAKIVAFDPPSTFPAMVADFDQLKASRLSLPGRKLADELLAALEELKEKSLSGDLRSFDIAKLQNKQFINILTDNLTKEWHQILGHLDTYFAVFKHIEAIKQEIKQKNKEIKKLEKLQYGGSHSNSSTSGKTLSAKLSAKELSKSKKSASNSKQSKSQTRSKTPQNSTQSRSISQTKSSKSKSNSLLKKYFKLKTVPVKLSLKKYSFKIQKRSCCSNLCQKIVNVFKNIWKKLF